MGSDFYGSYWFLRGEGRRAEPEGTKGPAEVLTKVHRLLQKGAG